MQQGNFIDVFLARHVSGTYVHHQKHYILNCSTWFSAPSFWIGGFLESRCVGRVYGADGVAQRTICCNSTSNVPNDGLMYPKRVELRINQ